jgi:ATP-dependent DNA helicase RecG
MIKVKPSLAPPVRLNGVTWIRVGPRRAIATPEEEKRLSERRRSRDLPFDLHPVPSATIEDMDLDLFEREYLPGAYVQFLRFEGIALTDPLRDQKEIDGTLSEFLRRMDEVIEANNSVSTSLISGIWTA